MKSFCFCEETVIALNSRAILLCDNPNLDQNLVKREGIESYTVCTCHSEAHPGPNDFHLKTVNATGIFHSLFTISLNTKV